MPRIGRRQPVASYVVRAGHSLAHMQLDVDAEHVSGSVNAYSPTIVIRSNAGTVTGSIVANSPVMSVKRLAYQPIDVPVFAYDPVTGAIWSAPADRAFVQTFAYDATIRVGPVPATAAASASSTGIAPTIPAGVVNVAPVVYTPSSFTVRFTSGSAAATAVVGNASVSFIRLFPAGTLDMAHTAYDPAKINIVFPSDYADASGAAYESIISLGRLPGEVTGDAVANQPVVRLGAPAGSADADIDVLIGIFSPRPVEVLASAYDAQFYLETPRHRTRDIDSENRVTMIRDESRIFTVEQRLDDVRTGR